MHIQDHRIQSNEVVEKKGFEELSPFSQDALSAVYYARTFAMNDGDVIKYPMTSGGRQFETEITVLGREEVSTKMGYMRSIKTKVITKFQNVLQQKGDAFMWFSDDDRKILLRFEAKVRIGWVAGIVRQIDYGLSPESHSRVTPTSLPHESTAIPTESSESQTSAVSGVEKGHVIKSEVTDEVGPSGLIGIIIPDFKPAENQESTRKHKRRSWFRQLLKQEEGE